ncbi:MAG: adenylate/guanylate cyclase domain-containing protein [Phenylobacterium sp.]|uniref:adenylate/guanylate cyclase domain-containing protein n=1 Tax=Phenylobacterium sp. TaxID=1871053 RepID=UPI001208286E|nr:adenylate/guanylate cyclase domain-containing protein [Phenylobacterium sp.]TAJ73967.1 MAG: adenylate/guanylate cyclase domain-containing protein [Phenylobacterium sp.]
MAAGARPGIFGPVLALVARLRAVGGKGFADAMVTLAVAILAAGAATWLGTTLPGRFVENLTYDYREAYGAPPSQRDFVIVKMDDAASQAMAEASPCHCLAPIDKAWLGDLIASLDAKGAKAIAVDYLLDTWSSPEEFADFERRIAGIKAPLIAVVDPGRTPGVDFPVSKKVLYSDARALMHVDVDDVIRRYDPRPGKYLAFATRVAQAVSNRPLPTEPFDIRYRRPDPNVQAENTGAIAPSYSAAFVSFLPEPLLKGKIAFIGSVTRSATQDSDAPKEDMHITPLRYRAGHTQGTPGVEVHVHALSQMLAGDRVLRPGPIWNGLMALVAALAGALLGRSTQRWWMSIGIVLLGAATLLFSAFAIYDRTALMVPMTTPLLSFAFGFFVLSRLAAAELQNQRAFYSSTLERYLAPQVIDRMVDGREEVKIGAEEREITVMISDLENFSTLVATLPLDTFSEVINEYFDGVIDILWKHEAMIDKMTGDGIIAIFGAPVASTDHADRAIACAREIDLYALEIRERMIGRGIKFGYTRMGLSSGIGLVGNFGGERRFNYTAYGEVVVIAARLEAANKTFGTRILFSGDTLKLAKNDVPIEAVGEIDLKGVPVPIPAYTTRIEAAG